MEIMRKVLRLVAILNLAYFFIEFIFAIQLESVSLLADSIDFLEDASINILVFIGLSWTLSSRKVLARILALFLMIPVILMIPSIVREIKDSNPPSGIGITFVAAGIGIGLLNSTSAIKVWRSAGRYREESS